ncbi:phophatidylserine decarboxylase associated domain-containing protein, partial [Kitasatospora sp. NPDC047058]|uniref:phophatidylserine decarboxylase associated domain-containing protein n=1 Tax=Kitasatospora sp. NPDC047058 TaxID=3155620 RepID=UPI0033DC19E9
MADDAVDQRYGNLYARLAGYLPEDRAAVDEWQEGFLLDVADSPRPPSRAVRELEQLIRHDPVVRMYVTEMLAGAKAPGRTVRTIPELLRALDAVTVTAPAYNPDRKKRVAFPMSALFVRMMMTTAGEALFRQEKFNRGLQRILKEWCTYLDGPDSRSVLNEGPDGWLSPDAAREFNLDDFEVDKGRPHWGFASYNAYFHRQIRPEKRPVDLDPDVVVSANDGTVWQTGTDVREYDEFWVKGQPYSLRDMLNGSVHTADFIG